MHYRRRIKFFLLKFLRLRGTPHKVALSFALGSIVNFIPTFGFAIPITAFVAGLLRINIVAAIVGDVVFKPLFPFFFYFDIRLGNLLLGKTGHHVGRELRALMHLKLAGLKFLGISFFLGMLVNALLLGLILYFIVFTSLKYFRRPLLHWIRNMKDIN